MKSKPAAKGSLNAPRVGFFETFSPVICFDVVHTVLAIPAKKVYLKLHARRIYVWSFLMVATP